MCLNFSSLFLQFFLVKMFDLYSFLSSIKKVHLGLKRKYIVKETLTTVFLYMNKLIRQKSSVHLSPLLEINKYTLNYYSFYLLQLILNIFIKLKKKISKNKILLKNPM